MPGNSHTMKTDARQQSLMTTINKFVQAVDEMQETVMIPSRLKDMSVGSVENTVAKLSNEQENHESSDESDDSLSSIDGDSTNGDMVQLALATTGRATDEESHLFNFYKMLGAVKAELSRDPNTTFEDEAGTEPDEQSLQTAAMVRHHLRGLFSVLHQLTDTANALTTRYQEELGLTTPAAFYT